MATSLSALPFSPLSLLHLLGILCKNVENEKKCWPLFVYICFYLDGVDCRHLSVGVLQIEIGIAIRIGSRALFTFETPGGQIVNPRAPRNQRCGKRLKVSRQT